MRLLGSSSSQLGARYFPWPPGIQTERRVPSAGRRLDRNFVPAERIELYKTEFNTRRRGPTEKLVDLSAGISKLARKAFPGAPAELVDQLARDRFIEALRSRDLRIRIREGTPKTLDEAVSRAIQLEAIYEAEGGGGKSPEKLVHVFEQHDQPKQHADDVMTTLLQHNTAALESVVNLVKSMADRPPSRAQNEQRDGTRTARRPRIITCWACGVPGHYRRNCPDRQSNQSENCWWVAPRVRRQQPPKPRPCVQERE